MFVSCEWYIYRPQWGADPSSREVLPRVYVSLMVIRYHNNPLHLQLVGRRGRTKELPSEPLEHTAWRQPSAATYSVSTAYS
jgi:hypothetical protein